LTKKGIAILFLLVLAMFIGCIITGLQTGSKYQTDLMGSSKLAEVSSVNITTSQSNFTVPQTPTIPAPAQAGSDASSQFQVNISPVEGLEIICIVLLIIIGVLALIEIKRNKK
jgi:hypothetical protein